MPVGQDAAYQKLAFFVGVAAMCGACYGFALLEIGDREVRTKAPSIIIGADQRAAFLAYVGRRQMRLGSLLERVSAGEVLPEEGVTYYDIPLSFGAGLYRCAV